MVMLAGNSFIQFRLSFVGLLIYNDLSLVVNKKKVWESFLKWSTLTPNQAVACVSGGTFPYVDATNTDGTVSGCFKPSQPDYISIFKYDAQNAACVKDDIKRNENLRRLEATILHELVHWGRHQNGAGQPRYKMENGKWVEKGLYDSKTGTIDVGKRFELDAYTDPDKPWLP